MKISKYNSFYYEAAFSASATAYFNQVTSNGGSLTNAEKTYINTFIGALGSDFAEFDRLWIHGLSNSVAARTSLANPTSTMITAVNSPTFTANQGYTGNGTTSYLDTNYNPSTGGVKFTINNASFGAYSTSIATTISVLMGGGTAVSRIHFYPRQGYVSLNNPGAFIGHTNATNGLRVVHRNNTTQVNQYINGTLTFTDAITSTSIPNSNIGISSTLINGIPTDLYNTNVASSFIGSGAINQATFYTALQALGTSIGWAI